MTLIVATDSLAYEIFNKDQELRNHVILVVAGVWVISGTCLLNPFDKAAIA